MMSAPLKDIYSPEFYAEFSKALRLAIEAFDEPRFNQLIFTPEFEGFELKQRMTHTATVLHEFLPEDFAAAVAIIKDTINHLRQMDIYEHTIEFMFFPEYISMYGMDDFDAAVDGIEFITQYTSCEFAVRPFIVKYEQAMLAQMHRWAKHSHHMVRRLASEGCRPRLPWAMALPALKKDPTPIAGILHQLFNDSHETVRRSVANNLNDIAKDNPQVVIDFAKQYKGTSKTADWTTKHACRTLLKDGNESVLKLFGFDSRNIQLLDFEIITPVVRVGEHLEFSFSILNNDEQAKLVRLEYGLYYRKQNGSLSRKVFKISERNIDANARHEIKRKQSFKVITTRKFHPGEHQLSIILNGQEMAVKGFELVM